MSKRSVRGFSAFLLLLFIFVTVTSSLAVADHECSGEDCSLCLFASGAKRIFTLTVSTLALVAHLVCLSLCLCLVQKRESLVSRKIKLNN